MSRRPDLRMPAEWEEHRATWIAWPHNRSDWPGKFGPVPWVFAEVARHLAQGERVQVLVNDATAQARAARVLRRAGVDLARIDFHRIATDRAWTRDTAPLFAWSRRGELVATSWRFNGWAKYDDWRRDDAVSGRVARAARAPVHEPVANGRRVVLEGGAVDVDGEGTLIATEECLLSDVQARNPGLSRDGFERIVREALGVGTVVWLGRGIAGDDTHGHVDDCCRFVAPGRVALAVEDDPRDENFAASHENLERLQRARDAAGRRLDVVRLPMPAPVAFDGRRLPASYANFYIANGRVLVPTFNDPKDRLALGILGELFPDRSVVGIHCLDLVWGLGTVHCMTQQEPGKGGDRTR